MSGNTKYCFLCKVLLPPEWKSIVCVGDQWWWEQLYGAHESFFHDRETFHALAIAVWPAWSALVLQHPDTPEQELWETFATSVLTPRLRAQRRTPASDAFLHNVRVAQRHAEPISSPKPKMERLLPIDIPSDLSLTDEERAEIDSVLLTSAEQTWLSTYVRSRYTDVDQLICIRLVRDRRAYIDTRIAEGMGRKHAATFFNREHFASCIAEQAQKRMRELEDRVATEEKRG